MVNSFKFGKHNARTALALGSLERSVMDVLWDSEELSGNMLFERLGSVHKIRHNTLLTVLERLVKKGLVSKRKEGKFSYYTALLGRDEFTKKIAGPLLDELLAISSGSAIAAFVDNARRDPDKLEYLKRLIEEADKSIIKNKKPKRYDE